MAYPRNKVVNAINEPEPLQRVCVRPTALVSLCMPIWVCKLRYPRLPYRRERACRTLGGDSMRYSTHLSRSANGPMKTLNGLQLQPLTSEHYCPWAADEDDVFDSVAHLAVTRLGADDNATCGTK